MTRPRNPIDAGARGPEEQPRSPEEPSDARRCRCGSLVGEHAPPEYTIAGVCDGFDPAPDPRITSARILAEVAAEADRLTGEGDDAAGVSAILDTMRCMSRESLVRLAAPALVALREKEEEADRG